MRSSFAPRRPIRTTPAYRRTGAVLIGVLVCLSIATAIAALTVRHSLDARRQGRVERQVRQTQYLLDAGIRRATERLRADESYVGETWEPTAALPRFGAARVEIRVAAGDAEDAVGDDADDAAGGDITNDDEPGDGTIAAAARQVEIIARLGPGESAAYPTQLSYRFPFPTAQATDTPSAAE